VSKDSDQTEAAPRKFKLGPLGSLNQVTKGLAKTIRAMADGTLDSAFVAVVAVDIEPVEISLGHSGQNGGGIAEMRPHLSVVDLLSKSLRGTVNPLFVDVDQMQRGWLRRLHDLRGKLTYPDADFGADRALGHEFEHGHAVAEDTAILDVTVRQIRGSRPHLPPSHLERKFVTL
jgi:hypothetical protein